MALRRIAVRGARTGISVMFVESPAAAMIHSGRI